MIPRSCAARTTFGGPDDVRQLREDGVVRERDRLREVDRPEVLALVVVDAPEPAADVDRHRMRVERRRRRDPRPQRRGEHERLERRAGLALALGREVELTLVVVAAADHREHGAGVRVERDERGRRADRRRELLRDRLRARASGGRDRSSSSRAARRRRPPPARSGGEAGRSRSSRSTARPGL